MKTYEGKRTIDGLVVTVDGKPLDEHYDVKRFTKYGFEWNYEGESPQQLALAILADYHHRLTTSDDDSDDREHDYRANTIWTGKYGGSEEQGLDADLAAVPQSDQYLYHPLHLHRARVVVPEDAPARR